jgi:hypothetical protein
MTDCRSRDELSLEVQIVQPLRFAQSPFFIFPRDAGEERDGGWNGLNGLNVWNRLLLAFAPEGSFLDRCWPMNNPG